MILDYLTKVHCFTLYQSRLNKSVFSPAGDPATHTGTKDMMTKGEDNTTDGDLVSGETTNPVSSDGKTTTTSTTTIFTPGEKEEETGL